jgi:hypothetical protein
MYCRNCKEYFDEDALVVTPMEEETGYVGQFCPHCGSDHVDETYQCKCCGEDRADSPGGFCDNCREQLAEELEELQKRFDITAEELEDMISEHYGY